MSKIILSKETISLIKISASVNQNLVFRQDSNLIWSMSVAKNVVFKAEAEETFPVDFYIYNINEFLGALTLFKNPELDFTDRVVTITEAGQSKGTKLRYGASAKEVLIYPTKQTSLPPADVEFNLTTEIIQQIQKAAGILNAPDLAVIGDGSSITLKVFDKKNSAVGVVDIPVSVTTDKKFQADIKIENLKLLVDNYVMSISFKGLSFFVSDKMSLFVALETTSSFN